MRNFLIATFMVLLLNSSKSQAITSGSVHLLDEVCRVADTRSSSWLAGPMLANNEYHVAVRCDPGGCSSSTAPGLSQGGSSACGIPDDATAVLINVTALQPASGGHLKAYPWGAPPAGPTSRLNFAVGYQVANEMWVTLAPEGSGHDIAFLPTANSGFVVDIVGYMLAE